MLKQRLDFAPAMAFQYTVNLPATDAVSHRLLVCGFDVGHFYYLPRLCLLLKSLQYWFWNETIAGRQIHG